MVYCHFERGEVRFSLVEELNPRNRLTQSLLTRLALTYPSGWPVDCVSRVLLQDRSSSNLASCIKRWLRSSLSGHWRWLLARRLLDRLDWSELEAGKRVGFEY